MVKKVEEKTKKFNKAEYDYQFHKENYVQVGFRLRNTSDEDIIKKLDSVENKAIYIKNLIRADIHKIK